MQQNNINNLIINKMTQAQYDTITPNNDELYFITDGVLQNSDVINALGYTPVNKAGDTMTGVLSISESSGAQIKIIHPTEVAGTTPSSEQATGVRFYDKNGTLLGYVQNVYNSDAKRVTMLNCRNADGTSHSNIMIGYDSNGNVYTSVPTPPSTSNDNNIATTAFCDGNWTIPSSTITICSSQSINGSGTWNYSLSTVLPNDTNLYEMQLLCIGETGSASGNRVQLILGNSNTYGNLKVHAFDVIARSAARVFANNTVLFLGHHADTLTVAKNSVYTGTVTIGCVAYRRVR